MHFRCIFVTPSVGDKFFAFGSASAERNENHKNQVDACFGSAGRNAQVRWGDFWGVCDLQIEIGILIFRLRIRHAVPCLRQGRRIQSLRAFRRARFIDAMVQWCSGKVRREEDNEEMPCRMHVAKQIM